MDKCDRYIINGGIPLKGTVKISGAKNAAVAIIPAVILCDEVCTIENVPDITDVTAICNILKRLGVKITISDDKSTLTIDPRNITSRKATNSHVRDIRASYYLLGALLGRFNDAYVSMPGGCDFGIRPIDQHLKGFEALGATSTSLKEGVVHVCAEELNGANIYFDVASVGATMNVMLAAVKAPGLTVLENVAKEPHVVDLANFLNSMGANIKGAGTDVIKIRGVEHLFSTTYSIMPDQIEAGTYMAAIAATKGDARVLNVIPKHLEVIIVKLREMGVTVEEDEDSVRVFSNKRLKRVNIKTSPYPGFPTDMQPQFCVLMAIAEGLSKLHEDVWDNRFKYIGELNRLGAKIDVVKDTAYIEGVEQLEGALVSATDLRAGAAMVIAGLCANGTTEIDNVAFIERGYENIVGKLQGLGTDIIKSGPPNSPDFPSSDKNNGCA